MRSWKSRWLDRLLLLLGALWVGLAQAETIALRDISFGLNEDAYELNLNADFELAPHLEQMLDRGVTLSFRVEFEISRSRWYWFDQRIARRNQHFRLSYQDLTRQYRVTSGHFQQSFPTLRQALRYLSGVRRWQITEAQNLNPGTEYEARLRFYLDISQLPKPLQLSAFTSSEWDLSSDTHAWRFVAGAPESAVK